MQRATILKPGNLDSYRSQFESYDSTKVGLGPLMFKSSGSGDSSFIGPNPIAIARPMEQSTAIASVFPYAIQWESDINGEIDWVFLCDNSTAGNTRRLNMYVFNRRVGTFAWQGTILLTYPTATAHTIRAFRMSYEKYTTGTVAGTVGTNSITGSGSSWSSDRLCVGSRIGFGSSVPSDITTWYEISAIGSDTSITLTSNLLTEITAGSSYVIEDLRAITVTTNATATNGGVYVAKGLRAENFNSSSTTIPAATTVDNIRAVYWLADASTVTNTVAFGCGLDERTSWTSQFLWVGDTLANPVLFKYNLRAPLTLTAGKATTAFEFKTGAGGAVTGTTSQLNNMRIATPQHGPGAGVECLYFTTSTRVYRTVPIDTITTGSTTWLSGGDVMVEIPPGGTSTFPASGSLSSIEFSSVIDKFYIITNSASTAHRSYVTEYNTSSAQFDRTFGTDSRQIDQAAADSSTVPHLTATTGTFSIWSEGGIAFIATVGTTSIANRLYAVPLAGDWQYTSLTGSRIILPEMTPDDMSAAIKVYTDGPRILGGTTGKNLGTLVEPHKIYYRMSGISDNSGSWIEVPSTGEINGSGNSIQFMLEFKTIGHFCLPARINSLCLIYEDSGGTDKYHLSATLSSAAAKQFVWRHAVAFGSTVPTLYVKLYDAVTGSVYVTDNTATPAGTFEKSTNGGSSWTAYNTTDKTNDITYIRYTPVSTPDNVKIRPVLSLTS